MMSLGEAEFMIEYRLTASVKNAPKTYIKPIKNIGTR